jgi:carboxymethylenebutenolidase
MDEKQDRQVDDASELGRRSFVALSVAAGLGAAAGSASAKELEVVITDVEVKTPDGICDAAFIHPKGGSHPGVLIWPDAFGLRPSMREIGKRIAAQGYSVLIPNPFYRVSKAPFTDASTFSFQNPEDRAKLTPLMASVNAPGNPEKDAVAYVAFLDAQKQVNKAKKIGTQGYCMGGPLVVRTAAVLPDRIGAGASFHGGGLVTDKP